jgi:hypothetical protein
MKRLPKSAFVRQIKRLPKSAFVRHLKRLAKAAFVGAAMALGAVLFVGGLRALGLWFSVPGSNCHGLCERTNLSGPVCPLTTIGLGGALVAMSLAVMFGSAEPVPVEEAVDGQH